MLDGEERNKWVDEKRWQSRTKGCQSYTYTMSFYLAEYDVNYTADHNQSVEDVPGVPNITLNLAACTASGGWEGGWGMGKRRGTKVWGALKGGAEELLEEESQQPEERSNR